MSKLGPHVLRSTPEAMDWCRVANAVKGVDNLDPFHTTPDSAVRIFRHYFANQDTSAPITTAQEIIASLQGYHHPNLLVEIFNEAHPTTMQLKDATDTLHAAGYRVAGGSWGTGDYTQVDWDIARASGCDAIAVHCYWGAVGFSTWHALRYRQFWRPGDPPVLITECGRDAVEGSLTGWHKSGLTPLQYVAELLNYDHEISKDAYVLGATPFSSGPTPDWKEFDMDSISGGLAKAANPSYSVGPGVAASIAAHHDTARSNEQYIGSDMSVTFTDLGAHWYSKQANQVYFFPKA